MKQVISQATSTSLLRRQTGACDSIQFIVCLSGRENRAWNASLFAPAVLSAPRCISDTCYFTLLRGFANTAGNLAHRGFLLLIVVEMQYRMACTMPWESIYCNLSNQYPFLSLKLSEIPLMQ